jgi:hypothetical protein
MKRIIILAALLVGCSTDTFTGDGGPIDPETKPDASDAADPDSSDPPDASPDAQADAADPPDADGGTVADASDGSPMDASPDVITATSKRVFHTTGTLAGNFGGHTAADNLCQTEATSAGFGGTWYAWISTSTESASAHLAHASVPYKMVDGTLIAADWLALVTSGVAHDITLTATGAPASGAVWTGTDASGNPATGDMCADWSTTSSSSYGEVGCITTSAWTSCVAGLCSGGAAGVYCFEQ